MESCSILRLTVARIFVRTPVGRAIGGGTAFNLAKQIDFRYCLFSRRIFPPLLGYCWARSKMPNIVITSKSIDVSDAS